MVVGLPLGVLAGRWAWAGFATSLGVVPVTVLPLTSLVVGLALLLVAGPLFTSLSTGDASTKMVEQYKLHPNRIKTLGTSGQGYLYNGEGIKPIVYGMLPPDLVATYPRAQRPVASRRLAPLRAFRHRSGGPGRR